MAEIITGLGPLTEAFAELGGVDAVRVSRLMVARGGRILKKEAQTLAQGYGLRKSGALINNIAIKRENTPDGVTQYNLGVRHGRDLTKKAKKAAGLKIRKGRIVRANDPFYWRFLEFDIKHRKGTSFIAAALVNQQDYAIGAMADALALELKKRGLR